MPIERELKLLTAAAGAPQLPSGWTLGSGALHQLRDTYLEAGGALARAGLALRRREGDPHGVLYTLKGEPEKTGTALTQRTEIEVGEQAPGEIPPTIVDALRAGGLSMDVPLTALHPDVLIEQVRNAWPLQHGGDAVATLSVDEVSATYAAQQVAWVEMEIEFSTSLSAVEVELLSTKLQDWFMKQPGYTLGGESKERRARRLVNERLGR
ncbi:MAG: CYTH domain-containing protein [Chloroflexota bacterium]|jgi:inorganic triphosphatase YgiF